MKKGGETFPGFGRKSAAAGRSAARTNLDDTLDAVLGGSDDVPKKTGATGGKRGKERKTTARSSRAGQSLTSSATDEDFYSSLAQFAGESFDSEDNGEEAMTEEDAKRMANSLAGMDDLETDLFGGSLNKTKSPVKDRKPSRPASTQPPTASKETAEFSQISRPSTAPEPKQSVGKGTTSRTQKPKKKIDFGEFDEDDPLAGLLSDDEEDIKPKKPSSKKASRSIPEKTPVTDPPPNPSPAADVDRPRSSRGKREATAGGVLPSSDKSGRMSGSSENDKTTPVKQDPSVDSPRGSPNHKVSSISALKPKTEQINFDSDEDLPGLDGRPPAMTPNTQEKELKVEAEPPKQRIPKQPQKNVGDLFGDDDDPLDDSANKSSRFNELLGKKEKTDSKKEVPKSLDDFMAKISSKPEKEPPPKKVTSPTSEDSFHFGSYTPSAAVGSGRSRGGLARPDTAPGKRSVRFADDLGLGDDVAPANDRPATAPSDRENGGNRRRGLDLGLNFGHGGEEGKKQESSGRDSSSKGPPKSDSPGSPTRRIPIPERQASGPRIDNTVSKSSDAGSDWLGLGDEVTFPAEIKSPASVEKDRTSDTSPTRSSRRMRGLGRESDGDEFLKMLGIGESDTPSKAQTIPSEPQPKHSMPESTGNESRLPWEDGSGSPRKGRHWRDQKQDEMPPASIEVRKQRGRETAEFVNPSEIPGGGDTERSSEAAATQIYSTPQRQQESMLPWERPRSQLSSTAHLNSQNSEHFPSSGRETSLSQQNPPQHLIPQQSLPPQAQQAYQQVQPQVQTNQPAHQPSTPQILHQSTPASVSSHSQYQYPSPISGVQQIAELERLELQKLTAESKLQKNQLMEYSVAEEQYAREKSRLEEEVKLLMSRVQEMDSVRQNKELDANSRISELEGKVRRLELEQEQLLMSLESTKRRHQEELENIEAAQKSHIKTLEESFQRREARLQEETELLITQHNERIRTLDAEKSDIQASAMRKVTLIETAKNAEIERLKELHRKTLDVMRQEHEDGIAHQRKLKEQEVAAALSAHSHTKSLQSVMQQVLNSTKEVSDMRYQVEAVHRSGLEERELAARARDEHLKQLQERLLRQQAENDEERARLQGLISRMEIHMREQSRQLDQDRWKVTQDESRVKAMQMSLDDERRMTMEQLAAERADVQRAKEELLVEQKRVVIQQQEERRALALERAQLATTHKELLARDHQKAVSSIQAGADLEVTAAKIKEDSAELISRQTQVKQDEERLKKEKINLERARAEFEEEKDRIGKLGLELQQRSRDIEELSKEAARTQDEGQRAYEMAERVRLNAENQRADLEGKLLLLQEKERQIAQDRMAMAQERRMLEMEKQAGHCWQCRPHSNTTPPPQTPLEHVTPSTIYLQTPVHSGPGKTSPVPSPLPVTPDLLMNSLELKRTLRRWSSDREKDEEFLEQETRFLDKLQRSHKLTSVGPSAGHVLQ